MHTRLTLASLGITASAVLAIGCITQQAPSDTVSSITAPSAISASGSTSTGSGDDRSGRTTASTTPATTPATGSTGSPTTPAPSPAPAPANVTVAYQQDLKPIFDADCTRCHSSSRPYGNYSMTTYAQVMRAVAAGNANSILIRFTQRGGSMYRYWSGNAQGKADLVRTWIVNNAAAQTR